MKISYIRDNDNGEFYKINRNTILIRWESWEIWKGDNKKGWNKWEEVKRKECQKYIKTANRERVKELIEVGNQAYFTTLEEAEKIKRKILEENQKKAHEEEQEQEERQGLKGNIRDLISHLEGIEVNSLSLNEIKRHRAYIDIVLSNFKGEIKDTKTTKEINKRERVEGYKANIKEYIEGGNFTSINRLCKDLKINRKTLYNLKLNEYIDSL